MTTKRNIQIVFDFHFTAKFAKQVQRAQRTMSMFNSLRS